MAQCKVYFFWHDGPDEARKALARIDSKVRQHREKGGKSVQEGVDGQAVDLAQADALGQGVLAGDEDLLTILIDHQEGSPSRAQLGLRASGSRQDRTGAWGHLVWVQLGDNPRAETLFLGKFLGWHPHRDRRFVDMILCSQNQPVDQAWAHLIQPLKAAAGPAYHAWLHRDETPTSLLRCIPMGLHWDRKTGQLEMSHAVRALSISAAGQMGSGRVHRIDSARMRGFKSHTGVALGRVDVNLSAQWIQTVRGHLDLSSDIKGLFPGGVIQTYTPKAFEKGWPRPGHVIGRSGYRVLDSQLKELPWRREILVVPGQDYAAQSRQIDLRGQVLTPGMDVRMATKFSYQASLWISYCFRQKRKEDLVCSLAASLPPSLLQNRQKNITLALPEIVVGQELPAWRPFADYSAGDKVQYQGRIYVAKISGTRGQHFLPHQWTEDVDGSWNLGPSTQPSFFSSHKGKLLVSAALAMAATELVWGTRTHIVELILDAGFGADLSLADEVIIDHPLLPQGQARGKICAWSFVVQGQKWPDRQAGKTSALNATGLANSMLDRQVFDGVDGAESKAHQQDSAAWPDAAFMGPFEGHGADQGCYVRIKVACSVTCPAAEAMSLPAGSDLSRSGFQAFMGQSPFQDEPLYANEDYAESQYAGPQSPVLVPGTGLSYVLDPKPKMATGPLNLADAGRALRIIHELKLINGSHDQEAHIRSLAGKPLEASDLEGRETRILSGFVPLPSQDVCHHELAAVVLAPLEESKAYTALQDHLSHCFAHQNQGQDQLNRGGV
jgi:hypothetical protein